MLSRIYIIVLQIVVIGLPMEAYGATVNDIVTMLQHFETTMPQLRQFVVALSYTLGVWFILKSVYMLKRYGQMRTMMAMNTSIARPAIVMLIGIGCIYIPTFINIGVDTLWGVGAHESVIQYPQDSGNWQAVINPLISVVKLFGLIAFLRGWVMLVKLGYENAQPGVTGKALMHMVGGILAINIVGTINVVKATFGL